MSLLDGGLASVFSAAFAGIYLPATLHQNALTYDEAGNPTGGLTDYPCRAQVDDMSQVMRAQAGYAENERRILVLRAGLTVDITTNDSITVKGDKYDIQSVNTDPASSYYELRGQRG